MENKIYFDNNATTKICDQVLKSMVAAYQMPLNPSAIHFFGRTATRTINAARENIKKLLNGANYNVIFTSGGTESNNLALFGFPEYKIISSEIEHPAIFNVASKKDASFVKVDENCVVSLEDLEDKLKNIGTKNFIVSVMLANNETGAIQPIKEIAKLTHQYGGLFHTDAIQGTGKISIDLEDLNVDMISISSHKLNGPQGAGALLVRSNLDIQPILYGSSQEKGKRPGTQNVVGSIGFGEACKLAIDKIEKYQELKSLRDYLEENIKKIAGDDAIIFSQNTPRLHNTCFVATKGMDSQTQLIELDLNGISVSSGSACSSGSSKPSKALGAMGVSDDIARCAIRISLGLENTKSEVDKFLEVWGNLHRKIKTENC